MRVLIIPEDPTLDKHVLKPIVEKIFDDIGRTARVEVLTDPHMRGVDQALDERVVREIILDNTMIDVFLIMVDRDCDRMGNETKARQRELEHPEKLLVCLAQQEVEVWMLALYRDQLGAPWSDIRRDCDPKERFAEPFLKKSGWQHSLAGGRKRAMSNLAGAWRGLLQVCPELQALKDKIRALLTS